MLDQAFEALKTYDWGTDRNLLNPIDEAALATANDAAARQRLEQRLAAQLSTPISRDAKDYVCRKLMLVGTAASVPALAALLTNAELSHMARYALERMPAPEAGQALLDALPKLKGPLKAGAIASLGARGDAPGSVAALAAALADSDSVVACAAACSLGELRTAEAAKALAEAKPANPQTAFAVTDASLACAEGLLAAGDKNAALAIYKSHIGEKELKHVRLAATRGMLACAGKKE